MQKVRTLTLEAYVLNNYNYLERLVDSHGIPYFNVFWTKPAEAAHDWPDFGDVMSRQYQAAIMGRVMTGVRVKNEDIWYKNIMGYLDEKEGLLIRPETNYSKAVADAGDASLTLYALVTSYALEQNPILKEKIFRMVEGLRKRVEPENEDKSFSHNGFLIKSLMAAERYAGCDLALHLAGKIVNNVFGEDHVFTPDNTFRHGGHMHGNLRTLLGAADYALRVKDPILYSRVNSIYQYVRSVTTSFGFLPEQIGRKGDVVLCETCALMDYIGLAVTLANHGHPEYWGDVERMTRNQLIESQAHDMEWLESDDARDDTEQFTWRDIGDRVEGAYAGWSSPTHFLAAEETLNAHWGGNELWDKIRLFQNCCGGSGTHAFFIVWKNAARFYQDMLWVNLHFDKKLPQAEIRCFQPYEGKTEISITQPCRQVAIRIPDFIDQGQFQISVNHLSIAPKISGNYLFVNNLNTGDQIQFEYPLKLWEEIVAIGNPGWAQYRYQVLWKGDTVIRMTPLGEEKTTGYSDFEQKPVRVYYGEDGPGRLYQRESYLIQLAVELSPIQQDEGKIDMWWFRD